MLQHFICPDEGKQPVEKCLSGECRMGERCAPLSFLTLAGTERVWTGKPSTTQLLKGTRQAFLELRTPYDKSPEDNTFAILGTGVHKLLEDSVDDHGFNEERVEIEEITGIMDRLEKQQDGSYYLQDFKVTGSFKVAKVLGITMKDVPVLDEDGEPLRYRTGKKAREIKTKKQIAYTEPDYGEWLYQLNFYRLAAKKFTGIDASKIKLFMVVRDGNTHIAKNRGVDRTFYYIDIPLMSEEEILSYFRYKRDALHKALNYEVLPHVCTDEETWNGKRCQDFCPVAQMCREMSQRFPELGQPAA